MIINTVYVTHIEHHFYIQPYLCAGKTHQKTTLRKSGIWSTNLKAVTYLFKYKTRGIYFQSKLNFFQIRDKNILLVYSLLRCIHVFELY